MRLKRQSLRGIRSTVSGQYIAQRAAKARIAPEATILLTLPLLEASPSSNSPASERVLIWITARAELCPYALRTPAKDGEDDPVTHIADRLDGVARPGCGVCLVERRHCGKPADDEGSRTCRRHGWPYACPGGGRTNRSFEQKRSGRRCRLRHDDLPSSDSPAGCRGRICRVERPA
jgi:hypothetical protein